MRELVTPSELSPEVQQMAREEARTATDGQLTTMPNGMSILLSGRSIFIYHAVGAIYVEG